MMSAFTSLQKSAEIFLDTYRYLQRAKKPGSSVKDLKLKWAQDVFSRMHIDLKAIGEPTKDKSVLFFGNHISYVDVALLVSLIPDVSFVAKAELQYWPIFGHAARTVDTVFVKREKKSSRKAVRDTVKSALQEGKRIAIFPAGTTCMRESKPWRHGAFEIAHETGVLVQPFRLNYRPLREVAYIDDDFFLTHLLNLLAHGKMEAEIEFHPPVKITDPAKDCQYWHQWSQGLLPHMQTPLLEKENP